MSKHIKHFYLPKRLEKTYFKNILENKNSKNRNLRSNYMYMRVGVVKNLISASSQSHTYSVVANSGPSPTLSAGCSNPATMHGGVRLFDYPTISLP